MPITVMRSDGSILQLADQPLSRPGGEGAVHRILKPAHLADHCVKLYRSPKEAQEREHKITFMVSNPPPSAQLDPQLHRICWPRDTVRSVGKFVGFVMPLAFERSLMLEELCALQMRNTSSSWQTRYDRRSDAGFLARFKIGVNLSIPMHVIHNTGSYVFVDFKPDNVMATEDGRISLIDLDSVQISHVGSKRPIYHAKVFTEDYAPPEVQHLDPAMNYISPSWDRFSLAVVLYRLIFGIHPYAASFIAQYQHLTSLSESIEHGLFVHGSRSGAVYKLPDPHKHFHNIPPSVQQLFRTAFDAGHAQPDLRPTAEQWGQILHQVIRASGQSAVPVGALKPQRYTNPQPPLPSAAPVYTPPSRSPPQSRTIPIGTTPLRTTLLRTTPPGVPPVQRTMPSPRQPSSPQRSSSWLGVLLVIGLLAACLAGGNNGQVSSRLPAGISLESHTSDSASDNSGLAPSSSGALPPAEPVSGSTMRIVQQPPIVSRGDWGAVEPSGWLFDQQPTLIVLTQEGQLFDPDQDSARHVKNIQYDHMSRWNDIAWHYIIDPNGTVYEGRSAEKRTDTSYGFDTDGVILIGLLGNYDTQEPNPDQMYKTEALMAWLCQKYHISPDNIYPHRTLAPKHPNSGQANTNPGRTIDIDEVRAGVRLIMSSGE